MISFGNWQAFLDSQTKGLNFVKDITKDRSQETIIHSLTVNDIVRRCPWVLDYFEKVQESQKNTPKCNEKAALHRNQGNEHFKRKQFQQALEKYHQCLQYASVYDPKSGTPSNELALGYANRSAVYFHKQLYKECLSDIEASLQSGYPEALQCKLYIRKAQCLVKLGLKEGASQALVQAQQSVQYVESDKQASTQKDIDALIKRVETLVETTESLEDLNHLPIPVDGFGKIVTQGSRAMDLKYSADQGRHLVANREIKAGEVLIVEKPYAAVLLPPHYKTHCHHCYAKLVAVYHCRQCLEVRYCSLECQKESWSSCHSVECPYMDLLHSIGIAHLGLRVVLTAGLKYLLEFRKNMQDIHNSHKAESKHIAGVTKEGKYERNYLSVYELMPHIDNLAPEDLVQYGLTASLLLKLLENCGYFDLLSISQHKPLDSTANKAQESTKQDTIPSVKSESPVMNTGIDDRLSQVELNQDHADIESVKVYIGGLLLRHVCQLVCNAHAITELQLTQMKESDLVDTQTQERIATAIYPTTSLLNHACKPTIINSFVKNVLVVRAVKSVKPGEQIYNCYGPHASRMPYKERQSSLKSQYFFTCRCKDCLTEGKNEKIFTAYLCPKCKGPLVIEDGSSIGKCADCNHEVNSASQLLMEQMKQEEIFFKTTQQMDKGEFEGSISVLLNVLSQQEKILYRHNRNLSQTQDATAKCYAMLGEYKKAAAHLKPTLLTTEKIYGKDSIEMANELQKYAEILLHGREKGACIQAIQEATDIFILHYGKGHAEVEQMNKLLMIAKYSL